MINCGIYRITNRTNRKFYIGSSNDIARRYLRHLVDLRKNKHDNQHLQLSWNKYGADNFTFEVYKICEPQLLLEEEQKELNIWVGKEECYNIRRDAVCPVKPGEHRSEEVKKKISLAQKGKPRLYARGNKWSLGRKHSPETIEKFKGRKHTEETKKKISEASKNQEWSAERCWNITLGKLKNKIPVNEFETIRLLYLSGINQRQLSIRYNITEHTMCKILKRLGVK